MNRQSVLIIEDDCGIRHLFSYVLTRAGYMVAETDSALGAAPLVRRLQPHLILLDLGLPYRSGASLLAQLKSDHRTADIPVLVISGVAESLTAERRAMAVGVIAKPVSPGSLVDAVRAACT